jgi:two-component system, NarL family, invasion response regulator UvrY
VKRENLKILIADDHAILRSGIRRVLQQLPEIGTISEAQNGGQVLQLVRAEHWDVLLLDLSMPGQNALDVLKLVKIEQPTLPVLIFSMHAEERYALRTLQAGAAGYLTKDITADQLIFALRSVVEGNTYVSSKLATLLTQRLRSDPAVAAHELLSDREFSVLCSLAAGQSVSAVALELNLSVKTVSTYRTRVLAKLNLRSNIDLARYAAEHELVA